MSEIKQTKHKLEIVKNGQDRSPDTSYTEYLSQDSKKVPDFMVEENFEYLGSEDIDTSRYISREFFEKEKECMWTRVWQFACRVEDIPEVGDSLVYDILDWSFLIVRSDENTIKAFYNSCLHRGRRIKTERGFGTMEKASFGHWTIGKIFTVTKLHK